MQSRPAEWHLMFKIIAVELLAVILCEINMIKNTLQIVIIRVTARKSGDEIVDCVFAIWFEGVACVFHIIVLLIISFKANMQATMPIFITIYRKL